MRNKHFPLLLLLFLLVANVSFGQSTDQNSSAKVLGTAEYRLPPAAVAAGIDGRLAIGLTVNAAGKASDVRIYSTPMWPCGARIPNSEIDEVRKTVKEHVLALSFAPEIKDGKARSVAVEITLTLTERIKGAAAIFGRLYRPNIAEPGLVDVGTLESRVESLKRPTKLVQSRGIATLQVLVDEKGEVASAGVFKGIPAVATAARDAVCESKFRPATVNGKPVPMTGTLTYFFK